MRVEPVRCALCGALYTSVVTKAVTGRRFVFSKLTHEAVCEPCVDNARRRLSEGPTLPVDTSRVFSVAATVEFDPRKEFVLDEE